MPTNNCIRQRSSANFEKKMIKWGRMSSSITNHFNDGPNFSVKPKPKPDMKTANDSNTTTRLLRLNERYWSLIDIKRTRNNNWNIRNFSWIQSPLTSCKFWPPRCHFEGIEDQEILENNYDEHELNQRRRDLIWWRCCTSICHWLILMHRMSVRLGEKSSRSSSLESKHIRFLIKSHENLKLEMGDF